MQVLRDVLDAHEEVLDTQYDDDDICYGVPECAAAGCNRQASSKQQAVVL